MQIRVSNQEEMRTAFDEHGTPEEVYCDAYTFVPDESYSANDVFDEAMFMLSRYNQPYVILIY